MTEVLLGLIAGCTLGLCVAPLWMMLQLPMRATDLCGGGSMPMTASALALGATLGALGAEGILPQFFGVIGMLTFPILAISGKQLIDSGVLRRAYYA